MSDAQQDTQEYHIAGARELFYTVTKDPKPVYHRGISDAAHSRIRRLIRKLSYADADKFASPPVGDASYRRSLRFLASLVSEEVPDEDMAMEVAGMLGGGKVDVHTVREILAGEGEVGERGGETPAALLRRARLLLRDGVSQREIAKRLGIARQQVTDLSTFLGATEARREVLMDKAIDHVGEGGTVTAFAEDNGISRNYAGKVIRETRKALA